MGPMKRSNTNHTDSKNYDKVNERKQRPRRNPYLGAYFHLNEVLYLEMKSLQKTMIGVADDRQVIIRCHNGIHTLFRYLFCIFEFMSEAIGGVFCKNRA